jgi:hypothetical protein
MMARLNLFFRPFGARFFPYSAPRLTLWAGILSALRAFGGTALNNTHDYDQ